MKKMTFAAAALAALIGSASFAQTATETAEPAADQIDAPGPMQDFATLDADGNGSVTLEELQARPAAQFAKADANGDGALSAEELQASIVQRMAEGMIARHDTNGDGLLQAEEMQPKGGMGMERMFDMVDADNDGAISQAEFDEAKATMEQMRGRGDGQGRGEGRGHGGQGGRHGGDHGEGRGNGGWFGFGGN